MNAIDEEKRHNPHKMPSHIKVASEHLLQQKQQLSNIPSGASSDGHSVLTLGSQPNTPFTIKARYALGRVTSREELKKKIPLEIARFSIVLFFTSYFLSLQPYNDSLSNRVNNPHDGIKLIVALVFIAFILASFYCVLKICSNRKRLNRNQNITRQKFHKKIVISALIMMIAAQGVMIAHVFMTFLVQYLTPIFFSLSCFLWMINCCLNKHSRLTKGIFILFFLVEMLGAIALFLNTLNISSSLIHAHLWDQYILPITLITSTTLAIFTTLEPCFIAYNRSMNYSMSDLFPIIESQSKLNIVSNASFENYRGDHKKQSYKQPQLFDDHSDTLIEKDEKNMKSDVNQIKTTLMHQSTNYQQ